MDEKKMDRLKVFPGSVLDQGYGVVGKRVMRDRTIKIGAKGLYCYLCVYGREVYPKRDTICYDLGISRDTYNSYLKELVEHGYVSVRQQRGEGNKFAGNLYTINIEIPPASESAESPQRKISATEENAVRGPCPKIPCTEKSTTEKPCTEKPAAGEGQGSPAASGSQASLAGANNTSSNITSLNQYNGTTTPEQDKVNTRNDDFSSAGDIITAIRQSKEKGQVAVAVVVDESVRSLMDWGEKIHELTNLSNEEQRSLMESLAGQEITVKSIKARKEELFAASGEAENLKGSAAQAQLENGSGECCSLEEDDCGTAAAGPAEEAIELSEEADDGAGSPELTSGVPADDLSGQVAAPGLRRMSEKKELMVSVDRLMSYCEGRHDASDTPCSGCVLEDGNQGCRMGTKPCMWHVESESRKM